MFNEYYDLVKDPVERFDYIVKELEKWISDVKIISNENLRPYLYYVKKRIFNEGARGKSACQGEIQEKK